jgi:hypothetical protein
MEKCAFLLTKYGLGYILGEFFTKSPGHPAKKPRLKKYAHFLGGRVQAK